MFIDQIAIESSVELQIIDDKKKIELFSTVKNQSNIENGDIHCCLVEPFMHENKLIRFDKGKLFAIIKNAEDNMNYKYFITAIKAIKYGDKVYHMLLSRDDAKYINRRDAVRVPLSVNLSVTGDKGTKQAVVKDISVSGISFIMNTSDIPEIGNFLTCTFEKFYKKYSVVCKVVRCVETSMNKSLVGCELLRNDQNINELVNELQMQNRPNRHR